MAENLTPEELDAKLAAIEAESKRVQEEYDRFVQSRIDDVFRQKLDEMSGYDFLGMEEGYDANTITDEYVELPADVEQALDALAGRNSYDDDGDFDEDAGGVDPLKDLFDTTMRYYQQSLWQPPRISQVLLGGEDNDNDQQG